MAAQILGASLYRDIDTVRVSVEGQRSGPGVVQDGPDAVLPCNLDYGRGVLNFHGRRAGRLHKNNAGIRPYEGLDSPPSRRS